MKWLSKFLPIPSLFRTPEQRIAKLILHMHWQDFESYICELFKRVGYHHAVVTGRDGPDGGKDIVIRHENDRYLVQCKHWSRELVNVQLLREFYAVMLENGAKAGYFVTLLGFTPSAVEYVKNKPIKLVNLPTLVKWHRLIETNHITLKTIAIADPQAPRCQSGILMKKRMGQNGAFWGCGDWPACECKNRHIDQENADEK